MLETSRFDVTDPDAAPGGAHLPVERRLGGTEYACHLSGPGGVTGTCTAPFLNGASVTLTSSMSTTEFSGDCTGTGTCTMVVSGAASVTARN